MHKTLLMLLLWAPPALGAFERGGILTPGSGVATVAVAGSPWTVFANPAGLPSIGARTLGLSHTPRPFGLGELSRSALAFVEPLPFGTAAVTLQRFGFELYKEVTVGLLFAGSPGEGWDVGVGANYYSLSIPGYGATGAFGIDVGTLLEVADDMRAGFSVLNLNAPVIGRERERLPQILSLGFSYRPMKGFLLAVDLVKDVRFPAELDAGLEYEPVSVVRLSVGSSTEPSSFRGGVTIHYHPVEAGYTFSTHPDLGGTHHFSLVLALDLF